MYPWVVQKAQQGTGGIAASTHASHQVVGMFAAFEFDQLAGNFLADDRLQVGHQLRVRMRAYGRAY